MRLKFDIINNEHSSDIQGLLINELKATWQDGTTDIRETGYRYLFLVDDILYVSSSRQDYDNFQGEESGLHHLFTDVLQRPVETVVTIHRGDMVVTEPSTVSTELNMHTYTGYFNAA